jgi:hypothetical protein
MRRHTSRNALKLLLLSLPCARTNSLSCPFSAHEGKESPDIGQIQERSKNHDSVLSSSKENGNTNTKSLPISCCDLVPWHTNNHQNSSTPPPIHPTYTQKSIQPFQPIHPHQDTPCRLNTSSGTKPSARSRTSFVTMATIGTSSAQTLLILPQKPQRHHRHNAKRQSTRPPRQTAILPQNRYSKQTPIVSSSSPSNMTTSGGCVQKDRSVLLDCRGD